MAEEKMMRINQVARKLNVGIHTIAEFLETKGYEIDGKPNSKITMEQFRILAKEFESSALDKEEASEMSIGIKHNDSFVIDKEEEAPKKEDEEQILIKNHSAKIETEEVETPPPPPPTPASTPPPTPVTEPAAEPEPEAEKPKLKGVKVLGKIDLDPKPKKEELVKDKPVEEVKEEKAPEKKPEAPAPPEEKVAEKPKDELIAAKADSLRGLKVVGKIDLPKKEEKPTPVASSDERQQEKRKRPRKRIQSGPPNRTSPGGPQRGKPGGGPGGRRQQRVEKAEPTEKEIQDQIKATLARLSGKSTGDKSNRSKYRREKRSAIAEAHEEKLIQEQEDSKLLNVTEFISANDLASLMEVSVNEVISSCMSLGMFVSINQRLDAESITIIADEFGYNVKFTSSEDEVVVIEEGDAEEELQVRAPIVTIMGHVDHGKTSLLDFIRDSKVTEDEAGGITQHIGAYKVITEGGKNITFLDTPGHEAFTAMRARGAKITDVVIIVVAADDSVMPQTKEAINHAQVAGVPIVIAINKIDKPQANAEKIKEELSNLNILVEDWGGKYQCQEISAKTGLGIDDLLEKVLLEAELLELKANPDKGAIGTVIEASLDKGRGYLTTVLVQSGSLRVGDVMLAGSHFGKVKAMFDHRGKKLDVAGPSMPVLMLGLDGAPQAGDSVNVMGTDREARDIANKREQIQREQDIRTKKHITLDEIGRRLAIGNFKELNVIVKGDVDGSIEALSDSLLKLSTEEVQVNIILKGVGQITESDVLLASASDAVIVGFQVRPSQGARKIAEKEEIEIRLYSIIYDAINDVKDAMEGMLAPTVEEIITGNIEVRDVFKISKVGTVAGCYVTDGYVKRNNRIRLIRDGIVVYNGEINQLKRFKDDVNEVKSGYECGLSIHNFNDIKVGDVIEGYEEREIKRTL